ncbi:ROK family protein [Roseiconus lacunae]|uniref:ROK family protein n=1 Tax=Roseiconus lacunae TaxID=2605694 RepID=A0ABT7PH03_9BACT|nr:ROK family protein [Roseiconus lacunae]MCD0458776.1 ROK family protein [Roseiconus lacunae]MDM4015756.1 ROK family protein [Roseiconus lacunae]WRQ52361.1 ROK family protein [Stieleria sp. HD01]
MSVSKASNPNKFAEIIPVAQANGPFYWGIDVGGTGIKLGLVDSAGYTVAFESIPTLESEGPEAAIKRVAEVVSRTESSLGIVGQVPHIGLGAPGPMDLPKGLLVAPPQLPSWWGFNIVRAIETATGRPVSFLNDANAAAYGEFWIGTGRDSDSMILLTLGTGVGGGIIVDGELVNGINSFGSECGHIIIDPSPTARLCVWGGGRGQLEAYASASAVVDRTRERLQEGATSSLCGTLGGANNELTAKKVYQAAQNDGDDLALEIVDETAKWLGIGIATLVHALDPGVVTLGGAMNFGGSECPIGRRFLSGIISEFQQRTFPNVFEGTSIAFATLGAAAGYLGLAGYARKQHAKPT